jgi:hypothetical protein
MIPPRLDRLIPTGLELREGARSNARSTRLAADWTGVGRARLNLPFIERAQIVVEVSVEALWPVLVLSPVGDTQPSGAVQSADPRPR